MSFWDWETNSYQESNRYMPTKCDRCGKECDVAYFFVWCTSVTRRPHCAACMKDKNCGQSKRLHLLAKYERHLKTLNDEEITKILEKVK